LYERLLVRAVKILSAARWAGRPSNTLTAAEDRETRQAGSAFLRPWSQP
jgi:hypothetical protein